MRCVAWPWPLAVVFAAQAKASTGRPPPTWAPTCSIRCVCLVAGIAHGLYSSVAERQSCKLKVLGSIPSGGSVTLLAESRCTHHPGEVVQHLPTARTHRRSAAEAGTHSLGLPRAACVVSPDRGHRRWHPLSGRAPAPWAEGAGSHAGRGQQKSAFTHTGCHVQHPVCVAWPQALPMASIAQWQSVSLVN